VAWGPAGRGRRDHPVNTYGLPGRQRYIGLKRVNVFGKEGGLQLGITFESSLHVGGGDALRLLMYEGRVRDSKVAPPVRVKNHEFRRHVDKGGHLVLTAVQTAFGTSFITVKYWGVSPG